MTGMQLFCLEMLASTQAMKLKLGRNKFDKRAVCNEQIRICFWKNTYDQADEIFDQLHLSKIIPSVSLSCSYDFRKLVNSMC